MQIQPTKPPWKCRWFGHDWETKSLQTPTEWVDVPETTRTNRQMDVGGILILGFPVSQETRHTTPAHKLGGGTETQGCTRCSAERTNMVWVTS